MMIINRSNLVFFLIIAALSFSNCKKEKDDVPNVYVNITINIRDADFSSLAIIGNSLIISGGNNGIILYRKSQEEFTALERTCTYDASLSCALKIQDNSITVVCDCCSSSFLLIDGSTTDATKPAILPLKKYNTSFDGDILTITN